jgi:hypothetical protein
MVMSIWAKLGIGLVTIAAIAFAVWRVVVWYDTQIDLAEQRGSDAAYAAVELKTITTNSQLDGAAVAIRDDNNAKNAAVDTVVRTVLVRGPGKAAAACPSVAIAEAGGHVDVAPRAQDALAPVRDGEGTEFVTLPFAAVVGIIGDHDKLLNNEIARRKNDQVTADILTAQST